MFQIYGSYTSINEYVYWYCMITKFEFKHNKLNSSLWIKS